MKQEKQKIKKVNSFVSNIKLVYNPDELQWNKEHTQNLQRKYCYCGKDRTLTTLNLQCIQCKNWFHVECLKNPKLIVSKSSVVPFMTNYKFTCQLCSPKESFEKVTASWKDAINAAFANLSVERLRKEGLINKQGHGVSIIPEGYWFDKKDGICPFLDKHWEALCTNRARTPTWWATVGSCMYTSKDNYIAKDEHARSAASEFILLDRDLFNLRPTGQGVPSLKGNSSSSENSKGKLKNEKSSKTQSINKKSNSITEISTKNQKSLMKNLKSQAKLSSTSSSSSSSLSNGTNSFINSINNSNQNILSRKNSKLMKKNNNGFSIRLKEVSLNELLDNVDNSNSPKEYLFNKNGYRYERVEVDKKLKNLIFKKKRDFTSLESAIHLCPFDCDSSISISRNGLTAHSNGGFRMARTNYGVKEGNWYFEIIVNKAGHGIGQERTTNGPNVRVGWSRLEATLHGPVGYDSYGYGYRDKTGEKLHESLPMPYGEPYRSGDVIGCYISLPPINKELLNKKNTKCNFNNNLNKSYSKSISLKEINNSMIVNKIEDLLPDVLSSKRVMHKRKIIKYKKRLYSETNDYLPINLPAIVQYNLKVKNSQISSDTIESSNFEDIKDELMKNIPLTSNDFPKLPNSKIVFYKNGKNQGVAFQDIPLPVAASSYLKREYRNCKFEPYSRSSNIYDDGSLGYYPSVSLFKGGSVTLNFGPEFKYPPNDIKESWKPLCDRYDEIQIEESLNDIINEVSMEDNNTHSKQKYYVAYSCDTKTTDNTNIENIPLKKKRKITVTNSISGMNENFDKKRKMGNEEYKTIRTAINTMPKIPKIKSFDADRKSVLESDKLQQQERGLPSINNSFKSNDPVNMKNSLNSINESHTIVNEDVSNSKIYNPKLFELSTSLDNEMGNVNESSIQNDKDINTFNSSISSISGNHNNNDNNGNLDFINNENKKIESAFEKMDSAIFINQ